MGNDTSYPRLAARTRNFTRGRPRSIRLSPDGSRVLFLRSRGGIDQVNCLWQLAAKSGEEVLVADPATLLADEDESLSPEERARRERLRETGGGIVAYELDRAAAVAAFALSGRLFRADLATLDVVEMSGPGPVIDPRPAPDGEHIAYVAAGALRVADAHGNDRVVAAEEGVTWGLAEFVAAEEMHRFEGHWWAPDSTRILAARVDESPVQRWHIADPAQPERPAVDVPYPRAGTPNADVQLAVLGLDGSRIDVDWDRDRFPYLVGVHWSENGPPLLTVMTRDQRTLQVLTLNADTGATSLLHEEVDEHWVELVVGVPAWGPDSRLVWTVDRDDVRRLTIEGDVVTPPSLHVRAVLDVTDRGVLVSASGEDPAHVLVYLVTWDRDVFPLTEHGVTSATIAGPDTVVRSIASLDRDGAMFTVESGDSTWEIASYAEAPPLTPQVSLLWAGDRRLRTGLVLPRGHVPGTKLPVLLDPYGGPHHQEVLAARNAWLEPQWLADQGFAVVVADGRGTPGRGADWERAVAGDLCTAPLQDQVDALRSVAADNADLDLSRVAIRGWSFGGYLAAAAVFRRPDVFRAAIAGAPVTDWSLYDTFYTERYLGTDPSDDRYRRSSILDDAPGLQGHLMIIHGLADDNVVVAHSLRLSSALLAAGKPHTVLPLSGVTHMAQQDVVAENLLLLQVEFLRRSLG